MKTKLNLLLVLLVLMSTKLVAQQTGNLSVTPDLDNPNFLRTYPIQAIGKELVATYKNNRNQYFYNPLLIVDWNNFKSQLDNYANQPETKPLRLLLKIYHHDQKVYDELKMLLERDEHIQGINLSCLPYNYYILKAKIGDDYIIINPTDLPTFSNIGQFQTTYRINTQRNYIISGSLRDVRDFYNFRSSNDYLKGNLYTGGFEYSSDYVKGTADFANSSTIKKQLFGDETYIDNQVVKSSTNDGGLSLSLGPLKLGGGKVDSKVWTENEKKRILNRTYVSDLIAANKTEIHILSMGDPDRVRETRNQIINFLLDKVASQITLEFQKIGDNEYNLIKDNLLYATLKDNQVETLLKSKPQSEITTGSKSGSNEDNITKKGNDDITWQYKGNQWIPTKVDMYILSDFQLKNSLSIDALQYNKEGKKAIDIAFIYPAAWLADNPQFIFQQIVDRDNPIGSILAFAGNKDKLPAGWRLCNGDAMPVSENIELFNIIGYNWGKQPNGDFNLPDLRGVFLRGLDLGKGYDTERKNTLTVGGELENDALQNHFHKSYKLTIDGGGDGRAVGEGGGKDGKIEHEWQATPVRDATNGRISSETRPKNHAVNYIIRSK